MKKAFTIIGIILILIVCGFLVFMFYTPKYYMGIQNDNIYFGMPYSSFKNVMKAPLETNEISETNSVSYLYEGKYDGYNLKGTYDFRKYNLADRLYSVYIEIDISNGKDTEHIFNKINNILIENYKTKKNYFNDGIGKNTLGLSTTLGTNDGATGVSITLEYSENGLSLRAINQE